MKNNPLFFTISVFLVDTFKVTSNTFLLIIRDETLFREKTTDASFAPLYIYQPIGIMTRVFANNPGDRDSIPGQAISKTPKMVLDAPLLNTQHYNV